MWPDPRRLPPRDGLRAGIVGAGFIGRVHARSARLAGAAIAGVAALYRVVHGGRRRSLGQRAFPRWRRSWWWPKGSTSCTCACPTTWTSPTRRRSGPASTSVRQKPLVLYAAGAASPVAGRQGQSTLGSRRSRSSTATTRPSARPARALVEERSASSLKALISRRRSGGLAPGCRRREWSSPSSGEAHARSRTSARTGAT